MPKSAEPARASRRYRYTAGAWVCFAGGGLFGLSGFASLLSEGPDPESGHIVGASPLIFIGCGAAAIAFVSVGRYLTRLGSR